MTTATASWDIRTPVTTTIMKRRGTGFRHGSSNAGAVPQAPPLESVARACNWIIDPCGDMIDWIVDNRRKRGTIINDRFDLVRSVAEVLRNPNQVSALDRAIRMTPFSRVEHARAVHGILSGILPRDTVERARMFIVYMAMGRDEDRTSFAGAKFSSREEAWRPDRPQLHAIRDTILSALMEHGEPTSIVKRYYQDGSLICCRLSRYNRDIVQKIIRLALKEDMAMAIIGQPDGLNEWQMKQLTERQEHNPVYLTTRALALVGA